MPRPGGRVSLEATRLKCDLSLLTAKARLGPLSLVTNDNKDQKDTHQRGMKERARKLPPNLASHVESEVGQQAAGSLTLLPRSQSYPQAHPFSLPAWRGVPS